MPERNEVVKQKQSAAIKMLLELQQVQHDASVQQQQHMEPTRELVDAPAAPGQSVSGIGSTPTTPRERMAWRIRPQVLDYVCVHPSAKQGVVLGTALEGRAFKVRVCNKAAGDTHCPCTAQPLLRLHLPCRWPWA